MSAIIEANDAGRSPVDPARAERAEVLVNVGSLDLNLLVSLDALLRERSVTRAATRLGLSQPALSSALRRLRRHFDDELLVRVGNTYQLTPLAAFLTARVAVALDDVERVFDARPEFDPAQCEREFTIVTSDYALAVIGPSLASAMAARAPRARIRFRQPALAQIPQVAVDLRTSDALIFPYGFFSKLPSLDVFTDRWVCIVDRHNESVGERVTLEQLGSMSWVTALAGPTVFIPALKQLELQRVAVDVQYVTDSFLAVPQLVAGSSRVAIMQERLLGTLRPDLGIRVVESPFDAPPIVEALWWHPLSDQDPEHQLLRAVFADVALALGDLAG